MTAHDAGNELHAETAVTYENGRHIVLDDATHSALLLKREHAEAVAAEIAALVTAARSAGH